MKQNKNDMIPWKTGDLLFGLDKDFLDRDDTFIKIGMASGVMTMRLAEHIQRRNRITPSRIISNGPALVIFWGDGEKTVVKCHDEDFDVEKGIAMALAKKIWGSRNKMNKFIKMVEYQDEEE